MDKIPQNLSHKRKCVIRFVSFLTLSVIALTWQGMGPVGAFSDPVEWSKPVNLSNSPPLSTHPAITSDDYGNIHVFWSEEVGGRARQPGDMGGQGNSILYTRWDGSSWSPAVDVLSVPGEMVAEYVAVATGPANKIHAVWTGQSVFYYSNASIWEADSAHAWLEPVVIATNSARSRLESSIVEDHLGNIHIIYATSSTEPGIYYIRSQDSGETWSPAALLSEPFDALEHSYSTVRIIADDEGILHAVWQTSQQEGFGQAVYYSRSIDQGQSWSSPTQLAYRDPGDMWIDWPYLVAEGDSRLHLIYVDGTNVGRAHRISIDGGETWPPADQILTTMEGINGYIVPLVDDSGRMHLIVNMRTTDGQTVGIYYAQREGSSWSPVVPLDVSSPAAPSAHYAAAVMGLGKEIHVVYNQISNGEIWYLRGILPAVESRRTPEPFPTTLPTAPTATSAAMAPTVQQVQEPSGLQQASSSSSPLPVSLLPGLGLALLVVASVVIWSLVRPR